MRRHATVPFALQAFAPSLVALAALGALVALAAGPRHLSAEEGAPPDAPPATRAVPDTEIGLVEGSVFEAPAPPPVRGNDSDPGDRPALLRPHPEAPPPIPHGIGDFLPITRGENACVDCHWLDEKEEGLPTPIPGSHFIDSRNAPDTVRETIAGARWVCVSCHVPQTDNPPLVGNGLKPVRPPGG